MNIENNLIKKKSKSFYFASIFLPKPIFKNCSVLYNFCRFVDDIADKKNSDKKKKLLKILRKIKNWNLKKKRLNLDIDLLISKKLIKSTCLIELINGVLLDTKKKVHILNETQLINYAYLVAGTVGLMMSDLLGNKNTYSNRYAVDLGIAMQLTNIMRDIVEDAKINRVYLPKSWANLKTKEILNKENSAVIKLKYATNKLYKLSEDYYDSSIKGLAFLPFKSRLAILLALFMYRGIGKKIIKNNYSNLRKREFTNIFEKIICLIKALSLFIFNLKIHFKQYNHDLQLHAKINESSFLKKNIYEKK